ncbi:hypothetical protein [Sphingobacterium populi]|uniref:hypothetical protein n=1 Tax=Sphingobacterium sp. CFCC 11742 TaxID=1775560 RepID=UPI000B05E23C|nr:hypothetical protein [Sphingobacterium sp. CFCC 11742]
MKLSFYTFFISSALCAALLLSSCTDLDVDIKSQYTEFPTTERAPKRSRPMYMLPTAAPWATIIGWCKRYHLMKRSA